MSKTNTPNSLSQNRTVLQYRWSAFLLNVSIESRKQITCLQSVQGPIKMRSIIKQKKFSSTVVILSILGIVFTFFQNCSKTQLGSPGNNDPQNQIAQIPFEGTPLIEVINATEAQCASGGKVYSVYNDFNKNFRLDEEDIVISIQVVCNGANGSNGSDGASSLLSMNRVSMGIEACAGRSGIQLSSGLDSNKNKLLEASEISHTEVLCDGANGVPGGSGPAGSNGHNAVFSIVSAPESVCANGGSIIMMALDINDSGIYNVELPNQQSATICNGANGMNAEPSPYQIVSMIKPCGDTVTNKEVLLRLQNGQLLASVSDTVSGHNTRLAIVADGNYINTDPSACSFSLATQNYIRSISWQGAVRQTWTMPH